MTLEIQAVTNNSTTFKRDVLDYVRRRGWDAQFTLGKRVVSDGPKEWARISTEPLLYAANIIRATFFPHDELELPLLNQIKGPDETRDTGRAYLFVLDAVLYEADTTDSENPLVDVIRRTIPRPIKPGNVEVPREFTFTRTRGEQPQRIQPATYATLGDIIEPASQIATWFKVVGELGYGTHPHTRQRR
jgi:hypothetical protein